MKSVIAAAVVLMAGAAQAQSVVGTFTVTGQGLDGAAYNGTAEIIATSDVTCEIYWNTGGQISQGICMRMENAFAASYMIDGVVGMAIYQVMPDGSMQGTWTIAGANGVGQETLTPG